MVKSMGGGGGGNLSGYNIFFYLSEMETFVQVWRRGDISVRSLDGLLKPLHESSMYD